jgi:hypothetical protein
MLLALLLLAADPPPRLDPISMRMERLCRSRASCVVKQRRAMREFYRTLGAVHLPSDAPETCLSRSTKRWLTNWVKADNCLEDESKKSKKRPPLKLTSRS